MNLVIFYGPPASGKLTVARALAEKVYYPILHNHLTADLASSLFPFGTREYSDLVWKIRFTCLRAAFVSKIPGLIITMTYGVETFEGKEDDAMVRQILKEAGKFRVEVLFVRLACSEEELARRVKSRSRLKFRKLSGVKDLTKILHDYPVQKAIPFVKSLVINTRVVNPERAAAIIAQRINAPAKLKRPTLAGRKRQRR